MNTYNQTVVPSGKFAALPTPDKPQAVWATNKQTQTVTGTLTPAADTNYAFTAIRDGNTKTGQCKTEGDKLVCKLPSGLGNWTFAITPSNAGGTGAADTRTINFTVLSKPSKPQVSWKVNKRKRNVAATVNRVRGVHYAFKAKSGQNTKVGKCRINGNKLVCALRLSKGKWKLIVTPSNASGIGKANTKTIKL